MTDPAHIDYIQKLEAEIGSLRADLKQQGEYSIKAYAERDQYMESNVALVAEIARLRSELDLARTGQMMSIQDLQAWREADHADAITLHRNFIIVILTTLERLRADKEAISQTASDYLHALTEIACFDDDGANKRLAKKGSYSSFDEPNSVYKARVALGYEK